MVPHSTTKTNRAESEAQMPQTNKNNLKKEEEDERERERERYQLNSHCGGVAMCDPTGFKAWTCSDCKGSGT